MVKNIAQKGALWKVWPKRYKKYELVCRPIKCSCTSWSWPLNHFIGLNTNKSEQNCIIPEEVRDAYHRLETPINQRKWTNRSEGRASFHRKEWEVDSCELPSHCVLIYLHSRGLAIIDLRVWNCFQNITRNQRSYPSYLLILSVGEITSQARSTIVLNTLCRIQLMCVGGWAGDGGECK